MSEAGFPFAIEPLTSGHDRAAFRSGVEPLDRYLAKGGRVLIALDPACDAFSHPRARNSWA